MTKIVLAQTPSDFKSIEQLAAKIWSHHYIPIIGKAQVDYMLDKFQTAKAIEQQIEEGFEYYLINFKDNTVGYLAVVKKEDILFLSKIYVLSDHRGKGIGKAAFAFIEDRAKQLACKSISLTVNKNNVNSIAAYEKLGYNNVDSIIIDIGNGFIMDDYKFEKEI